MSKEKMVLNGIYPTKHHKINLSLLAPEICSKHPKIRIHMETLQLKTGYLLSTAFILYTLNPSSNWKHLNPKGKLERISVIYIRHKCDNIKFLDDNSKWERN